MGSISQDLFRESMILIPVKTSDRYPGITSIAYFPDGQRMISGSGDKTARRWDLQSGKEIEEAQDVCKEEIRAVAVSRDGRWVVTGGGDDYLAELKACKVESAVVKRFEGHSDMINCLDISADNALLASGSDDKTARIWNLDTGKLVAGPFQSEDWVGAVRFSQNSKKLAVKSPTGKYLEVWDIQSQKLDVRKGKCDRPGGFTYAPVFWTNKNKTIIAAFSFTDHEPTTIYEFDASTLKTIGTPFKGHTRIVKSLALLFDGAFLVSTSDDFTAKLWAFESRQLLGSYDCDNTIQTLVSSPNSLQVAFTAYADSDIYIWNATPALLAIPGVPRSDATLKHLLNSDATRRPAAVRKTPANLKRPVIFSPPRRHFLPHVRKLFHFTSRTNTVPPVQPRDPWDFPATSPLPPNRSPSAHANHSNDFELSSPHRRSNGIMESLHQGLSFRRFGSQHEPPVVEVAVGRKFTRLAAAKLPEYRKVDDTRRPTRQQTAVPQDDPSSNSSDVDSLPDVHWFKAFFCYYSCWSHGRLRMPPRWRLERVDMPRQDDATSSRRGGS